MQWLRNILDQIAPMFEKDGKLEKLQPLYEATDTILFSTDEKTKSGPHIRDSIDIKRVMILVVIALIPCYFFGALNIGYQESLTFKMVESDFKRNFISGFTSVSRFTISNIAWASARSVRRNFNRAGVT